MGLTMSISRLPLVIRAVQRGVRWLKENSETLKDARDIAISISAIVAAERNPHSHLVQRLLSSLAQLQSSNGSWSDELWDTTWAARALMDGGYPSSDRTIQAALGFLKATQDPVSGTWYEEPFETMLVLEVVASIVPEEVGFLSERPLKWVASLQKADGMLIGTRYTGMAASLFLLAQRTGIVSQSPVARLSLQQIRRDLDAKPIWTAAAWSNYYPLKALLDSGVLLDDPVVAKAVDWFLDNQDSDGKWMQVSKVHDTAMAVLILSTLLSVPLVDVSDPHTGVLSISRENGTIRVSFQDPGSGAITPAEKMKISDQVRADLSQNQQALVAAAMQHVRSKRPSSRPIKSGRTEVRAELEKTGRYAYGHLIPGKIQKVLGLSHADHLRLDIDERLIDLPWELIHDGSEFLCLKYAVGRRLTSDQPFSSPRRHPRSALQTRVLVVADPTSDLPAAGREGREVGTLLRESCSMQVDEFTASAMTKRDFLLCLKDYDIVHFAGHASHDAASPDESCLVMSDGEIQAFEIERFIASRSPAVVFLNACWSAEELRDPDSYSPMMRGLGRTFLYAGVAAFIGYLIPVPDDSATRFAVAFYEALSQGQTIGESVRRARICCRDPKAPNDLTWSSAVLYGDPAARAIETVTPSS